MKKIFVAGHRGMVGSAICRQLLERTNVEIITRTRAELDLCDQLAVHDFMKLNNPDEVVLAAAKVGGIHANNTYPAEFIYENLQIQNNVINSAHLVGINKLLFLGSSCIYPRYAKQPMRENALLTGPLEPTNEPYALAKIAGIKMCESYNRQYGRDYRSVMPTNLYGPGDNYHPDNSHVLPALIRRIHEAKVNKLNEVIVWGTGAPKREFLHVDDMASASLFVHNLSKEDYAKSTNERMSHVNVGSGDEISIKDLAHKIGEVIGYEGQILFDHTKPDGAPRKLMDNSLLNKLGWSPRTHLSTGIRMTYSSFLESIRD